jgi:hypothetical protein
LQTLTELTRLAVLRPKLIQWVPSFLAFAGKMYKIKAMKLGAAILIYLVIGVILSFGVLLLLAGKPWLLIAALLAYVIAFGKIGCMSH